MASNTYRPEPTGEGDYPPDIRLKFQRGVETLTIDKYGVDGTPELMCETLRGILRVSHSGIGQYGPWINARVETDQAGEFKGKDITIWGGWREKTNKPNQLYQVIEYAWKEWGSGARVLFQRLPDNDREHCYSVTSLDDDARSLRPLCPR